MKLKSKKIIIAIVVIFIAIACSILGMIKYKQVKEEIRISNMSSEDRLAMTYGEVEEDDIKTESDNVTFSSFFTRDLDGDGYAERIKGTCKEIGNQDTLYADLNISGEGYLKDGKITLNANNFTWTTSIIEDNIVDGDYLGKTNTIKLKEKVYGGSQKLFFGSIASSIGNNINNYSQISSMTLTGTYIIEDENGNITSQKEINKTVDFTVDWYGTTKTEVNRYYTSKNYSTSYLNQQKDIETLINEDNVVVKFQAVVSETEYELMLQKQIAEVKIPNLNGYEPLEVKVTNSNVNYNYDEENKILTITRESSLNAETGEITSTIARSNINDVEVTYPIEAYTSMDGNTVTLDITITGYNYGYNNKSSEFTNPYESKAEGTMTVTYSKPEGDFWGLHAYIGAKVRVTENDVNYTRYKVSKELPTNIYNGNNYEDVQDTYPVEWQVEVGDYEQIQKITLQEQAEGNTVKSDEFLNTLGSYESMKEFIATKAIYFSNSTRILGNEGWIKLYNAETGSLIETFTKENWNKYTKDLPYEIKIENLKSIKIETSKPINQGTFSVFQIKEINDEMLATNYTKVNFDKLSYIYTYVHGKVDLEERASSELDVSNYANYEMPYSIQSLSISPYRITNQKTEKLTFTVSTTKGNNFEKEWKNGVFLIELPEEIIALNITNIKCSNDKVEIKTYDVYKENEKQFIKIYTENEEEDSFKITIDSDVTGNPLETTKTSNINLYAYNQNCDNYKNNTKDKYDIDNDNNTNDLVGYAKTSLTLVAPSGLLTTEFITDYDDLGSTTIAPNIAEIKKEDVTKTAKINVSLTNNYSGTISEIAVLGKIPFKGNAYVLTNEKLKSDFTANLKGEITVPESLKNIVKVYYSENEMPDKNLQDDANDWKLAENVSDWTKIRTYLIDFGDYKLSVAENEMFSYEVEVPADLGYNQASFSTHAVYFCLDTENGKLQTQLEPNKVGIQVVAKYNMQITKNKKAYDNMKVAGATYRAVCQNIDEKIIANTATTNEQGILIFKGLYIGREYTLEEIVAPENYAVDEAEVKFIAKINESGELEFETTSGDLKNIPQITIDENGNYLVKAEIEDEAKYTINVHKTDENGNDLSNVKYVIKGKNKSGIFKTNSEGNITVKDLYIDEEYSIREIEANGYYVDQESRIFKIIRNSEGKLELQIKSENTEDEVLKTATINEEDGIVQAIVSFEVPNEKIPTYNLQILKVKEDYKEEDITKLEPLAGANFVIESVDTGSQEECTSNENGIIKVSNLYQYVEDKYITGEYIIRETKAPEGYSNNAEEILFKASKNAENKLQAEIENKENLKTYKAIITDDETNTVTLVLQDKPLFKLTKVDSETGELLVNAKFIIYELDKDGKEIDYAKDANGNYIGEKDEDGDYIVTTNEEGKIILPLRGGTYKAIEVGYPEGYQEKSNETFFKVSDIEEEQEEQEQQKDENIIIEISSIDDLVALSNEVNNGNPYVGYTIKLTKSLDFEDSNSYRDESLKANLVKSSGGQGFTPIGKNYSNSFSGTFDGNNNKIENLYINTQEQYAGLFGYTKNADIKNLGVTGEISSSRYAGGIVGYVYDGNITNCYNMGKVSSNTVGGISGKGGNISNCYNAGEISSSGSYNSAGGIVGYVSARSSISNCYNTGKVSSNSNDIGHVGGIVGNINISNIVNCYNVGEVSSSNYQSYAGGIAGYTYSCNISNCYNTEKISSTSYGTRESYSYAGGIAGYVENSSISNCYNTENISSSRNSSYGKSYAGGIVGYTNSNSTTNCYYLDDIEIDGEEINLQGTSKTKANMQTEEFVNLLGIQYWGADTEYKNNGYPIQSIKYINEIEYIEDLVDLSIMVNDGIDYKDRIVKLNKTLNFNDNSSYRNAERTDYGDLNGDDEVNDIKTELTKKSEIGFTPIGKDKKLCFSGTFDGQGYKIEDLYINTNDNTYVDVDGSRNNAGLFGHIINAEIKNLEVKGEISNNDSNSMSYSYAGGIVGYANNSSITKCYYTGEVNGSGYAGGIVGYANSSNITNCYNTGIVNSRSRSYYYGYSYSYAGGIAGYASGSHITNCYNTGVINSSNDNSSMDRYNYAGGIAGYANNSGITNCYYCLEDMRIMGETISNYGEATNDSYMKSREFYNKLNIDGVWAYRKNSYPILSTGIPANLVESTEITIDNTIKKFKITTEVEGSVGGNITGDGEEDFDVVEYGKNSTKEIIMTPDAGYGISKITINGKELDYKKDNENNNYSIPAGYFKNITEDKHIVVTFTKLDQILQINKVDAEDKKGLANARFKIETVEIPETDEDYISEKLTTNEYGEIKIAVPLNAKIQVTEITAPEGYTLNKEAQTITIEANENNELTFENVKQRRLTVHHYLKDTDGSYTEKKVAEDDIITGDIGSTYTTSPHVDLENLTLEKDDEGKFVKPENATGTYGDSAIEVNYYYELQPINLTIHHYLEGTENKLLDDETILGEPEINFDEDENYNISTDSRYSVNDEKYKEKLSEDYYISKILSIYGDTLNIGDTFEFTENTELIYFYKYKEYNITTKVNSHIENKFDEVLNENVDIEVEGGTITGEYNSEYLEENKIKFVEKVEKFKTQENIIKVIPNEEYVVNEIKVISIDEDGNKTESIIYGKNVDDNAEIEYTINSDMSIELSKLENITANKQIEVSFIKQSLVIVHHYYKQSDGVKTTNKVAEDDVFIGALEHKYTTTSHDDLEYFKLDNSLIPANANGLYEIDTIEVNYYYELEPIKLTVHHYLEENNTKLVEDKDIVIPSHAEASENGIYKVVINADYILANNEEYINLLEEHELSKIISSTGETLNIENSFNFNRNSELTYYYKAKIPCTFKFYKNWTNIPEADVNNYKSTFKLKKTVNGITSDYTDKNGNIVTKTITGNGQAEFENIWAFEGENKIEYSVEEIKVEKTQDDGNTWQELPIEDYKSVYNKSEVLENKVKVGDYINYSPASGSGAGLRFTSSQAKAGTSITQTFNSSDLTSWRVFSIDDGKIQIIPVQPTSQKVTFDGAYAYINSEAMLNEISAIYGQGNGAISARSLTAEDLEQYFRFNKNEFENSNSSTGLYGGTKEYTGGSFIVNNELVSGAQIIEQGSYFYEARSYNYSQEENADANMVYNMLFKNIDTNSKPYWLATKGADLQSNNCRFDVLCGNNGYVGRIHLYSSNGSATNNSLRVMPVVTLDSGLYGEKDENDVWQILQDNKGYTVENTLTPNYRIKKEWNVKNSNNYKATFKLMKTVDGQTKEAVDDEGNVITQTITGNGTVTFRNLKPYENEKKVTYSVIETKIEKTEDNWQTSQELDMELFSVGHKQANGFDDVITNSLNNKFSLNINITEDTENLPLEDINFTVSIKDEENTELTEANVTYTSGEDGNLLENLNELPINSENKRFTITITQNSEKAGYKRIENPVTFEVTSKLSNNGVTYILVPENKNVTNTKGVEVEENSILVKLQNSYIAEYEVHYFYDGIENIEAKLNYQAKVGDSIENYESKPLGMVLEKAKALNAEGIEESLPLTVRKDKTNNIINVYYRTQYKITTKVNKHSEKYTNKTETNVAGGTISGANLSVYENVFKGEDSTKQIKITPNEGYAISSVKVNGVEKLQDLSEKINDTDGSLTLAVTGETNSAGGYFTDIQENKEIEVEFRKKTKITVKYLEKDSKAVLAEEKVISGLENDTFGNTDEKHIIERIAVENYKAAKVTAITEQGTSVETEISGEIVDEVIKEAFAEIKEDETGKKYVKGTMYADEITLIYWYEKIPTGVWVRHVEIDEVGKVSGEKTEIKLAEKVTFTDSTKQITRESFDGYIPVDCPNNMAPISNGIVQEGNIVANATENSKTVTYSAGETVEVWFFYEQEHKITTEVVMHKETIEGIQKDVEGGTISKNYKLDEHGNLTDEEEKYFEKVLHRGNSSKKIEIVPQEGYRIKQILIDENKQDLTLLVKEDGTVTLDAGAIKDVKKDISVKVEFEKIPAKVIVKYIDIETNKEIINSKEVNGYVGDSYNEQRISIEGYKEAGENPTNAQGTMTKDKITVIYYYSRLRKITTEVKLHKETRNGQTIMVKGGSISGEIESPYEYVVKGNSSTKEIIITKEIGYAIKKVTINDIKQDITVNEGGTYILPLFENVSEDIHVAVEFAQIPAKVKVLYLEIVKQNGEDIEKEISELELINGYVNDEYHTNAKEINYYKLIEEKIPENKDGVMTKDEITVKYYYEKVKQQESEPVEKPEQQPEIRPEPETETKQETKPTPVAEKVPKQETKPETDTKQEYVPVATNTEKKQEEVTTKTDTKENIPQTGQTRTIYIGIIAIIIASSIVIVAIICKSRKNKMM